MRENKTEWVIGEYNDGPCVTYPVDDSWGRQTWVPLNRHYKPRGAAGDAYLIAAAPEMFELLLDIVADYHTGDMDVQSVAREAKRLIAKVRGKVTP